MAEQNTGAVRGKVIRIRHSTSGGGQRLADGSGLSTSQRACFSSSRGALGGSSGGSRDLLSREEEYMRLNAELEAKTAGLIQEAEEVMREQEDILSRSLTQLELDESRNATYLSTSPIFDTEPPLVSDDISKPSSISSTNLAQNKRPPSRSRPSSSNAQPPSNARPPSSNARPQSANSRPPSSNARPSSTNARPPSSNAGPQSTNARPPSSNARPQSANARIPPPSRTKKMASAGKSRSPAASQTLVDNVAIPNGSSRGGDFSLADTFNAIESRLDEGDFPTDTMDDILPEAAEGMGSEATIRFLKAKLRVMQEELDRLAQDCNKKEERNSKLEIRIREAEEERARLQRINTAQQTQIEKYKKMSDEAKRKSDGLETQLTGVRKELEAVKRGQKQSASSHNATEVRLNRALEEVDRLKSEVHKARQTSRDSSDHEKKRVDQLVVENRRLEKQKSELMAGFKKQLKLIDILKRQKLHIEAAKMLSFTEEEFVKALEWGD